MVLRSKLPDGNVLAIVDSHTLLDHIGTIARANTDSMIEQIRCRIAYAHTLVKPWPPVQLWESDCSGCAGIFGDVCINYHEEETRGTTGSLYSLLAFEIKIK